MNILIVDDLEQDRRMLRRIIHKQHPEYKISEASNLSHMYAELSKPCELLFLDISLNGNNNPDDAGLNAIYDIIDGYPDLPVCLITGYFKEKVHKFLGGFLTETLQIINCLDKGEYESEDLLKIYSKAEKYRFQFQEKLGDDRASEDLLLEVLEAEKERFEKQFSKRIKNLESRMNLLKLKEKAYEGSDWASRIDAENVITGGSCQQNAVHLCIEIDKLSKFLCGNGNPDFYRFYPRTVYLSEKSCISDSTKTMLNDTWRIRNMIIHASKIASYQDTLKLLDAVELFKRLKEKQ